MTSESDEDTINTAQTNCHTLINLLLSFSLNLVRFKGRNKFTEPSGLATGFLVQSGMQAYLLSAGHSMRRKSPWFWETGVVCEQSRRTVCIPVGPFTLIEENTISPGRAAKASDIDFAWCAFDLQKPQRIIGENPCLKGRILEPQFYKGPLDGLPVLHDEAYTFAAWNRGTLIPLGSLFLERSPSYETCMTFTGVNSKGNYIFKLARPHMGHKYYRGASGAPIAAPDGQIISMVLGGDRKSNVIYGLPLAKFSYLLHLS